MRELGKETTSGQLGKPAKKRAAKRNRNRKLAAQTVASLKPGKWLTENFDYGEGALQVYASTKGPRFYFRYSGPSGQARVRIPSFDETGAAMTLAGARKYARSLSARYQAGERDLRAAIAAEERERVRARAQAEKALEAAKEADTATLGALLEAYIEKQEADGKADARGVRNLIRLHVKKDFPELWERQASEVSLDDVLEMLGALTEAGKNRTAGKLRAYMRAAFSLALNSGRNAQLKAFRRFKVGANPAADIQPIEGANRARDRALSAPELRALWQRVQSIDDAIGPALRFYLLTGGQRFAQLRRARVSDISEEGLTLWDSKGKRKEPRRHVVPLLPEAVEAMEAMASPRLGDFVFTLTHGQTGADHAAAFKRVKKISGEMVEAGEASEPFTISDLRRTVETRLAALKVPMDVRAQIQSHGLGGVQARHYDRHDYADEKREALERLRDMMTQTPAKVHKLPGARA